MSAPIKTNGTLSLKKRDELRPSDYLRFIDKKGRYILQFNDGGEWRDVPFIGSLSDVQVVKP
jgi:hypothetical protein